MLAATAALSVAGSPARAAEPPFRDADYWAFADRIAGALDSRWDAHRGAYKSLHPGTNHPEYNIRYNAGLLLAHSVAALEDHRGESRRDGRARILADKMTRSPAWGPTVMNSHLGRPSACWATDMFNRRFGHMSLDSKVAEALTWTWKARRQLHLSRAVTARIVDKVNRCAHHRIWRYPALTGTQINWFSELYSSAATVTGSGALLRGDYHWQLQRYVNAIARPMTGRRARNLGVGYQYHYHPELPASAPVNIDSSEYANIVAQALEYYDQALAAHMRPLTRRSEKRLQAWVGRILGGYWTHAGYLNWDTGLGRGRWHSAQYWAFAQQGLSALATSPRFWSRPEIGRWSKALFDRGLMFYVRLADEAGSDLAPSHLWGIHSDMEEYDCFTARMLANAARAVGMGLGHMRGVDPPPLYSYDYDTGRVAVSTPMYSTAIVPFNRGAFPYGGIDPVRLFGPDQKPVGSLGGRPPQAYGIVVKDRRSGHELLASSRPLHRNVGKPLRLTESPFGAVSRPLSYPFKPYAGPFRRLSAIGTTARGRLSITAHHTFLRDEIQSSWRVACRGGRCDARVILNLPSYGRLTRVWVELKNGSIVELRGRLRQTSPVVTAGDVDRIILGENPGYEVMPVSVQKAARIMLVSSKRQKTNPTPGPTVAVELTLPTGFRSRGLSVRSFPGVSRVRDLQP